MIAIKKSLFLEIAIEPVMAQVDHLLAELKSSRHIEDSQRQLERLAFIERQFEQLLQLLNNLCNVDSN
jgi:hypothetical protein